MPALSRRSLSLASSRPPTINWQQILVKHTGRARLMRPMNDCIFSVCSKCFRSCFNCFMFFPIKTNLWFLPQNASYGSNIRNRKGSIYLYIPLTMSKRNQARACIWNSISDQTKPLDYYLLVSKRPACQSRWSSSPRTARSPAPAPPARSPWTAAPRGLWGSRFRSSCSRYPASRRRTVTTHMDQKKNQ